MYIFSAAAICTSYNIRGPDNKIRLVLVATTVGFIIYLTVTVNIYL